MAEYKKIQWFDKIKDQYGNIIQEGTPLSARNFNRIEKGINDIALEVNNNSSIIRDAIPSGFTKFSDIDFAYSSMNPNKIRLSGDSIAFVNGWRIVIQDGTIIDIWDPPSTGKREDFVFLECWIDANTNEIRYRIRCVNGVDFSKTVNGFRTPGELWSDISVFAQGGNNAPIVNTDLVYVGLTGVTHSGDNAYRNWKTIDGGLYISGDGTQKSKDILKTSDGYVYAVPMFKIWRRNSSPFSDVNPNGAASFNVANNLFVLNCNNQGLDTTNSTAIWIVNTQEQYDKLKVSDILTLKDNRRANNYKEYSIKILAKLDNKQIQVQSLLGGWSQGTFDRSFFRTDRPDFLTNDIIDKADIIDLRHKVSLSGFDYNSLLDENFDLVLRGELQASNYKRMLKTYHGIRKTPIDANTIFYCSFDGTIKPELDSVGCTELAGSESWKFGTSSTGLGLICSSSNSILPTLKFKENSFSNNMPYTIDLILYVNKLDCSKLPIGIQMGKGNQYDRFLAYEIKQGNMKEGFNHIRVTCNGDKTIKNGYVNGKKVGTVYNSRYGDLIGPWFIRLGWDCNASAFCALDFTVCDLTISNIDRGDVFQTLPKDVISEYGKITTTLNEQRYCLSDALSSENKCDILKCVAGTYPRQYTVKQSSSNWTDGDTIKIRGLAGELIMGIVDSDTTLCKVIQDGKDIIYVDDISKFAVNDTFMQRAQDGRLWGPYTVSAIDATNKSITTNAGNVSKGDLLIEISLISSTPTVKAFNNGVLEQKIGTWSGLGTNEATFTLGSNANLTNQDLQIEYSLAEPDGGGCFSDIPHQILNGEVNGQKLQLNGSHIIDDFKGKVRGSTLENPHIAKYGGSPNLIAPSADGWTEYGGIQDPQYQYSSLAIKDGVSGIVGGVSSGGRANILFSWNIVETIERKYGPIPSLNKVQWCYDNIATIACVWSGYGSGPGGNKAHFVPWRYKTALWEEGPWYSKDSLVQNYPKEVVLYYGHNDYFAISNYMDLTGWVHFMAYAEIADNTTNSSILTDYVYLEITFNRPGLGYDLLTPINPRRDGGISNILAVRKETNEIRNIYGPTIKETSGLITNSIYMPYQGTAILPKSGIYPLTDWKVIASSIGTGGYDPNGNAMAKLYKGIYNLPLYTRLNLPKFKCEMLDINGDKTSITQVTCHTVNYSKDYPVVLNCPIYDVALNHPLYRGYKLEDFIGIDDFVNGVYGLHADANIKGNYYLIAGRLVLDNYGNILLLLTRSYSDFLFNDGQNIGAADTFYLKNKPIVGGV